MSIIMDEPCDERERAITRSFEVVIQRARRVIADVLRQENPREHHCPVSVQRGRRLDDACITFQVDNRRQLCALRR